MSCSCTLHFDQQLLDHIAFHQNAEAKLMLNKKLAKAFDCCGTLLHRAAAVGNEDIAKHLIDMGSWVDSPGLDAKTPLMMAVERSREMVVRVLLEAGADINVVDADGKSALDKALRLTCVDFDIVEAILLRARAETPATEELIERLLVAGCPFPYFVLLRDVDILENLLQRGFDVNDRTCLERTALHLAALIKDSKSAQLLVARGADVNASDYCLAGPLYYAVDGADLDMMLFLLDHGADPASEVDFVEQLPLYACFNITDCDDEQVRECIELLLERGAFPWRPCYFVKGLDPMFRTSRLNCLVAHQAALDAFGVRSCEDEEHLTTLVELREYYDKCREFLQVQVVEKMTMVKLFFVDSDHEIKLRARDQRFVRQVEQFCAEVKLKHVFPYYAKVLKNQIAKAARAVEFEKRTIFAVYALFESDYNQLSIFARQVVSYLSKHDLEQLCCV